MATIMTITIDEDAAGNFQATVDSPSVTTSRAASDLVANEIATIINSDSDTRLCSRPRARPVGRVARACKASPLQATKGGEST
jgi:hypothetical protein